jgi:ABC-2 type transport system permease protein
MTMTALTAERPQSAAAPAKRGRAGLPGTIRSEFTKIRSVRSTYWALALLVLASITWSVVFSAGTADHWAHMSAQARAGNDPTQNSVLGLALLGQLVIVVLGALAITSEYSTGMMRTSLTVMPRRWVVYEAKALVFAAVALCTAFLASFICFSAGQRVLASTHDAASLSQPNVARALIASALFVGLCGLFALGLGAVLRNTAGTIAGAYGILFLIPELARALPTAWYQDVLRWLPGGYFVSQITYTNPQGSIPHMFSPWGELAVFSCYTAALLIAGAIVLRRRDA